MTLEQNGVALHPAPWDLRGRGYILVYRFPSALVENNGFLDDTFAGAFHGGLGFAMCVDYQSSTIGPYQELLFIPGNVSYRGYRGKTISKIYVSTNDSVVNGRINWGIPKELAHFQFQETGRKVETVEVQAGPRTFFTAEFKYGGLKFPVATALAPFRLMQCRDELLFTKFSGRGWAQLASVRNLRIDRDLFPDFSDIKPLIAVRIDPFVIRFPAARRPP